MVFEGVILLMGDFKEVSSLDDRLNCENFSPSMIYFNDFINSTELLDLLL